MIRTRHIRSNAVSFEFDPTNRKLLGALAHQMGLTALAISSAGLWYIYHAYNGTSELIYGAIGAAMITVGLGTWYSGKNFARLVTQQQDDLGSLRRALIRLGTLFTLQAFLGAGVLLYTAVCTAIQP